MAMNVGAVARRLPQARQHIREATLPDIRFRRINENESVKPLNDLPQRAGWIDYRMQHRVKRGETVRSQSPWNFMECTLKPGRVSNDGKVHQHLNMSSKACRPKRTHLIS